MKDADDNNGGGVAHLAGVEVVVVVAEAEIVEEIGVLHLQRLCYYLVMATRRKVLEVMPEPEVQVAKSTTWTVEKKKVVAGAAVVVALVGLWWYKTKTWPIAAVVNYQPITRYEVEKGLFDQGGEQVADNIITETLVKQELSKLGVTPSEAEIDAKVEDIKKGLQEGQELDKMLTDAGMTMAQLRERIGLQLGVEKAVTEQAKIATDEADRLQEEIGKWVDGLKTNAKIWKFF